VEVVWSISKQINWSTHGELMVSRQCTTILSEFCAIHPLNFFRTHNKPPGTTFCALTIEKMDDFCEWSGANVVSMVNFHESQSVQLMKSSHFTTIKK